MPPSYQLPASLATFNYYRRLSAPTSFGKSLLIDAMVASGRYSCIVVIVPTIALIDETRRRMSARFGTHFKVITHASQAPSKKNIYVFTQERFLENSEKLKPDFFVIDEFYKLSPNRGDERTFTLNQAFYQLLKSGSQFFLIGPNVSNITIDGKHLHFRYFDMHFTTVAAEVRHIATRDVLGETLRICQGLQDPTLIFCKSAHSAYTLAHYLRAGGVAAPNEDVYNTPGFLDQ